MRLVDETALVTGSGIGQAVAGRVPARGGPAVSDRVTAGRRWVSLPEAGRIAYQEAGTGPDVVLLHGALVNADDMALGPMPLLAERYRVVAFDRPGHGLSDRAWPRDASLWRQADILRTAARSLGLVRPLLVGHSYGGAVALAWAMSFPDEVAGVVALAPICFPEPRLEQALFGPRILPFVRGLPTALLHAVADPILLPTLWRAMFLPQAMPVRYADRFSFGLAGTAGQTVREGEDAALLWADLTRSAVGYPGCRVPTRFLCGGADMVVNNLVQGRNAARLIPGAGFTWLPGIGHMLHHVRPAEVAAAVDAFGLGG